MALTFSRTDYATHLHLSGPVVLADVNGDGNLDGVVGEPSELSVLLGNGDGTFQDYIASPTTIGLPALGDLNGDGILDIAGTNYADNEGPVYIALGNGDGTFQTPSVAATGFDHPYATAIADVNRDGSTDLVVANTGQYVGGQTVSVLLGNGDGTFQSRNDYGTGTSPFSVVAADLSGDGNLDLATANADSNTVSVLLGNGDGTFQAQVTYPTGAYPFAITAGDLNGDGAPDLAVTNYNGRSVSVLIGTGGGTFQPEGSYATGGSEPPVAIQNGDLDGDGNVDLVVANGGSGVAILLGYGDGTFQPQSSYGVEGAGGLAIADLDADGRLDLVTNAGAGMSAFLNTTTANSGPPVVTVTATTATATEGNDVVFKFHRTGDLSNPMQLDFGYNGSATNDVDFTWVGNNGLPPRFEAGSDTYEHRLTTFSDGLTEGSESLGIYLVSNYGYTVGDSGTATATLYDPPVVTVTATTTTATEGNDVVFTFHRTGDLSSPMQLDFGNNGSATNEVDFTWAGNNGLPPRFEAGSDTYEHRLTTFSDGLTEGSESLGIYLVSNYGYTVGDPGTATATLYDEDTTADELPTASVTINDGDGFISDAEKSAVGFTIVGVDPDAVAMVRFSDGNPLHDVVRGPGGDGSSAVDLSGLSDGPITASISLTDTAGNTAAGTGDTSTKDTTADASPTASVTINDGDGFINAGERSAVGFTIVGVDPDAVAMVRFSDGNPLHDVVRGPGGDGSSAVDLSGLTDGPITASISVADTAGNTAAGTGDTSTKDTTAPAAPTLALTNDTGSLNNDKVTRDPSITYTASAAGHTLLYKADGATSFSTIAPVFSTNGTADGPHTVFVEEQDSAGNVSAAASLTFRLDTIAPVAPSLKLHTDSGSSSTDKITNSGLVDVTGLEIGANWQYSTDNGAHWLNGTGTSLTLTGDGPKGVIVHQTDVAGNTSSNSAAFAFALDTTPPVTAIDDILVTASKGTNATISGTSEAGSTITLFQDGTPVSSTTPIKVDGNGHWNFTISKLPDVVHTFSARAADVAGNQGGLSSIAVLGSSSGDKIKGAGAADLIEGLGGADQLTGGAGTADTFVFHAGFGKDTITSFDLTMDVLAFDHNLFGNVDAILKAITDVKGNAVITYDSADTITLVGITKSDLVNHASDFHLL